MKIESLERINGLVHGSEFDPFSFLGIHASGSGYIARAFLPDARAVVALPLKSDQPLGELRHLEGGLWEGEVSLSGCEPIRYRITYEHGDHTIVDPYTFGPVLGEMDDYFMAEGSHLRLFDKLGAHVIEHEGVTGVHFAVWAPNARRVSLLCDANAWDGRRHAMRARHGSGIWEIFMPDFGPGTAYKFEIVGPDGALLPEKADPMAFQSELRPATASVVAAPSSHKWTDDEHRQFWSDVDARRQAVSIYEVHAGSWRRDEHGNFLHWDRLADELIPYVADMGFTHIEFLPIMEHPFDPSWGYQVTGMFSPSARFGDPDGFARFVEGAHKAGLGVILDWVPAHFPLDEHGLANFDGTALYEHADPRKGFHPDWKTAIYNFGRKEVEAFLVSNAIYWAEKYHIDGLRVDAVASMLYLDYSREDGEWIPNEDGGRENWETVNFLKRMNKEVYGQFPGMMTVAEESTAWPGVSKPVHDGGLGFGFKWNMGFMHDTLQYMSRDPVYRRHHHDEITFGLMYAFSENFVLPLSHDEVVHGKGSLLNKMSGTDLEQFANLRAYYGLMWGYPGKKLLFMGQEFAQRNEWREDEALDWWLTDYEHHEGVRKLVRDLNRTYREKPALHGRDCEGEGFQWLITDARDESLFAWRRDSPDHATIVVVSHFTPVHRADRWMQFPHPGLWREILNTDAEEYGGGGMGNYGLIETDENGWASVAVPPLSTLMFEYEGRKAEIS